MNIKNKLKLWNDFLLRKLSWKKYCELTGGYDK